MLLSEVHATNKNPLVIYHNPRLEEITELCANSLCHLSHESTLDEMACAMEELYEILHKKGFISDKVDSSSIVDSNKIRVTPNVYSSFAHILAKYTAKMFGTFDVYMYNEDVPGHDMFFVGMPDNVNVSAVVCEFLYRLFCEKKSEFIKSMLNAWQVFCGEVRVGVSIVTDTKKEMAANFELSRLLRDFRPSKVCLEQRK